MTGLTLWLLAVSSLGYVLGASPLPGTLAQCEQQAQLVVLSATAQRTLAGLGPNGNYATCVYAVKQPKTGTPVPRRGRV